LGSKVSISNHLKRHKMKICLLIVDVVISGLNDFGNVGNVGHTNTINIGGIEVTIKPKAIERVD